MMQQHLVSLNHAHKEHAYRRMQQLTNMTDKLHPNSERTKLIKGARLRSATATTLLFHGDKYLDDDKVGL